jgi:hypothetical protein
MYAQGELFHLLTGPTHFELGREGIVISLEVEMMELRQYYLASWRLKRA